jgi:hypothetical protein
VKLRPICGHCPQDQHTTEEWPDRCANTDRAWNPTDKEWNPMSQHPTTPLAETQIGHSSHDVIEIVLVEPDGLPAKVRVVWPEHPSLIDPKDFPDTAATVAQLFARAHVVLASLKAGREL